MIDNLIIFQFGGKWTICVFKLQLWLFRKVHCSETLQPKHCYCILVWTWSSSHDLISFLSTGTAPLCLDRVTCDCIQLTEMMWARLDIPRDLKSSSVMNELKTKTKRKTTSWLERQGFTIGHGAVSLSTKRMAKESLIHLFCLHCWLIVAS